MEENVHEALLLVCLFILFIYFYCDSTLLNSLSFFLFLLEEKKKRRNVCFSLEFCASFHILAVNIMQLYEDKAMQRLRPAFII